MVLNRKGAPATLIREIHIEELILNGFRFSERYAISEALEQELQRLLPDCLPLKTAPDRLEVDSLEGRSFTIGSNFGSRRIGTEVAGSVVGALQGLSGQKS